MPIYGGLLVFQGRLNKNRYIVSEDWGAATLLESNTGDAKEAQIAFDGNGNAIVVWIQEDGMGYNTVYAKRYNAETGDWSIFTTLERGNSNAYG